MIINEKMSETNSNFQEMKLFKPNEVPKSADALTLRKVHYNPIYFFKLSLTTASSSCNNNNSSLII